MAELLTKKNAIIAGFLLLLIGQGESIRSYLETNSELKTRQLNISQKIVEEKQESRENLKLSKAALDRYRAGCIFVVDPETGADAHFIPGEKVQAAMGSPDRNLRAGAVICNRLGETAKVSQAGTVIDIQRVALVDQPEFTEILKFAE